MRLSEEQTLIRDSAQSFSTAVLKPQSAANDKLAQFPSKAIEEMAELGFMGMLLPDEFGGAGSDHLSYALALEEIAAGDGACSTIMSVHNSVACMPIYSFGTDDQKNRYLHDMTSGRKLGAFCLTEPEAGSDAGSLSCQAIREGDHYILNGTKQFITSGKSAALAIVFARTGEGKQGITAFIIETNNPGYIVSRVEDKLGQRASDTCQIVLDNCRVPVSDRLGEEGQGYKIALSNLEGGRIGIAAQSVGMARAAFEHAKQYANSRITFNTPIINHQSVGFMLADMATQIEAARLMVWRAAAMRDHQEPCLIEASMAKLFASEMAEKVCSDAIQIHGGYGYLADYPVEQIARDVRVCKLYEGTSEVQRLLISRSLIDTAN
ncbi:MAG: acyl-CoA dehydrogenase family protein [Gammaproteobacteria bacterium]|nr:acyl-CoA dehydrogenase family protein [Gammaproteobacteria bacterium]